MDSSASRLSKLQRDLVEAFFREERGFVLTGGAALGGFHLGHRESKDLDLFARPPANLDLAEVALVAAAGTCGATIETQVRHPEFRRYLSTRDRETTLVDLVVDRAPVVDSAEITFGPVRVHSMREIAANKICALLGRCEIRDLVDLRALMQAGISLEGALADAAIKDRGTNPATLAWLLDQLAIGGDAIIPGGGDARSLDGFRRDLVQRLRAMAFPGQT